MKRRYEKTVTGGTVKVLIQESQEDLVHVLAHDKGTLSQLTPAGRREVVNREEPRISSKVLEAKNKLREIAMSLSVADS